MNLGFSEGKAQKKKIGKKKEKGEEGRRGDRQRRKRNKQMFRLHSIHGQTEQQKVKKVKSLPVSYNLLRLLHSLSVLLSLTKERRRREILVATASEDSSKLLQSREMQI